MTQTCVQFVYGTDESNEIIMHIKEHFGDLSDDLEIRVTPHGSYSNVDVHNFNASYEEVEGRFDEVSNGDELLESIHGDITCSH